MSGDIVTRIFELLVEACPSLSKEVVAGIQRQIRHEFTGERAYILKRDETLTSRIVEKFNGRNIADISRELQVSRRTVYRALQRWRASGRCSASND